MLSTADKVGIGVGILALGGIIYEVAKNSKKSEKTYRILSPNTNKVYTAPNYRQAVNEAQGQSFTLSNGEHEFVFGEYPMQSNGRLSTSFVPSTTQPPYIWGTGNVSNG